MAIIDFLGFLGAFIIGVVLGLIGGGGSILTVPLLVYLLSYNPVVATAYSLFVVGTSSVFGVFKKHQKKLVDFKTGLAFSFPSFIAVYVTRRYLVPNIPGEIFNLNGFVITKEIAIMLFFAIVMLAAATSMIKTKKETVGLFIKQPYYKTFIQGLVIGVITGLIGAGGGFLYVPALVLWAGLSMKKAVGTSLVIIAINSIIGFLGDLHALNTDWMFLLTFSGLTILGVFLGDYLSKFISNKKLKKGFGWFIMFMAVYIIIKEFTQN
ncbi:sulfite exporter TauE/SafE family protein [Mariniflexile litorale]|uniref:Probable membrane transporter protein n=1 Tax=Mariniflexile litorale TaxID=3045158 RepID=A0AAU7EEN4_9FLAO|nr:sulfite exporter TauE/SafE family protein [Mariniflexile sp. KMM 9835]MDQ8212895.1 sulfite exporter TauE/SafE family protein [Mariniflexile sp. KMM 9835]